jgi:hypothetical protein
MAVHDLERLHPGFKRLFFDRAGAFRSKGLTEPDDGSNESANDDGHQCERDVILHFSSLFAGARLTAPGMWAEWDHAPPRIAGSTVIIGSQ